MSSRVRESTGIILLALITTCALAQACAPAQARSTPPALAGAPAPRPTPTVTSRPILTRTPTATPKATSEPGTCSLPDLVPGQHISTSGSYTQTERQAAGPMVCRIQRDSCAYRFLVGNLDPTIIFKREEEPPYDGEDMLMHPDMIMPLYRLNKLVQAEWGGAIQLRITEAYDSLLEHDLDQSEKSRKCALHFEGRSIDLTTWPIEPGRYGRLCALAHCAGFDWVHHEEDHCHASIQAESLCLRCNN